MPHNFPNSTGPPGPEGVGLERALEGYAIWTKEILIPGYCADSPYWRDKLTLECFDSYNASSPYYTDISVQNSNGMRQWMWLLCNEPWATPIRLVIQLVIILNDDRFKFWQNGAPEGTPTLVSRLINNGYCKSGFLHTTLGEVRCTSTSVLLRIRLAVINPVPHKAMTDSWRSRGAPVSAVLSPGRGLHVRHRPGRFGEEAKRVDRGMVQEHQAGDVGQRRV